jgi:hypothetical protein
LHRSLCRIRQPTRADRFWSTRLDFMRLDGKDWETCLNSRNSNLIAFPFFFRD